MFLSCTTPPVHQTQAAVKHDPVPHQWKPTTLSPVTQTHYTTVYETVMPAACETSSWMATYTVTETCTGKPADYVTPTMPPGFVVTTVSCPSCKPTEIEITCPGAYPTGPEMPAPTYSIAGNGVTATVTVYPTETMGYLTAQPTGSAEAVPTVTVMTGASDSSGSGSCSSGSCSGSGTGSSPGVGSASGSYPGSGSGSCSGAGCGTGTGTGSGSGSSYPGSGSGSGSGLSSCGSAGCNSTTTAPPAAVTAGAASLSGAFALFSGLALAAGHFLLL